MSKEEHPDVDESQKFSHEKTASYEARNLGSEAREALDYFAEHQPFTEKEAKQVLRKIDFRLIPLLAVTYGLQFVDKITLSYAANYGLIQDANLVGTQYNWLGSAFYFSYLIFELPLVALMQKFPISKFLSVNIFIWGCIVMIHAAAHNFSGLLVCRLFLGVFEATISPGSNLITGRFYTKKELPFRISCWVSFNGMGQFIGALLAYGIGNINGKLPSWKYVFLILGAATAAWGIVLFFFLDSSPTNAKFLTERERRIAVARVASNKSGVSVEKKINRKQIMDAATDPQIILIFFISVAMTLPNGGITNFLSLVIKGIGFSPVQAMLHQLPVGAVQFVIMLVGGWMVGAIPRGRIYTCIFWLLPCLICSALLWKLPRSNTTGLLISCYFLSPFVVTLIAVLAMMNFNVAGTTKKGMANGVYFVGYCVGNIGGPFFFKTEQAPTYTDGCVMMVVCFAICIVLLYALRLYYVWENNRRKNKLRESGIDASLHEEEAEKLGFLDKTDRENPYFLYSL